MRGEQKAYANESRAAAVEPATVRAADKSETPLVAILRGTLRTAGVDRRSSDLTGHALFVITRDVIADRAGMHRLTVRWRVRHTACLGADLRDGASVLHAGVLHRGPRRQAVLCVEQMSTFGRAGESRAISDRPSLHAVRCTRRVRMGDRQRGRENRAG